MSDSPDAEDRLALYAHSDEPLNDAEVRSVRLGRCGPLRYGGPCWLPRNHEGQHDAREEVARVEPSDDQLDPGGLSFRYSLRLGSHDTGERDGPPWVAALFLAAVVALTLGPWLVGVVALVMVLT